MIVKSHRNDPITLFQVWRENVGWKGIILKAATVYTHNIIQPAPLKAQLSFKESDHNEVMTYFRFLLRGEK